jgi:MFS family permease
MAFLLHCFPCKYFQHIASCCLLLFNCVSQVLLLSRGFVGFGLAGAPVAFTLLMELLPARNRGTWGTAVELAWTAGDLLCFALTSVIFHLQQCFSALKRALCDGGSWLQMFQHQ